MTRAIRFILGTDPKACDTSSPAAIIRFGLVAAIVYAIFCWLEPTLLETYRAWYRGFGNAMFSHRVGSVRFFDISEHDPRPEIEAIIGVKLPAKFKALEMEGEKDTVLMLQNRSAPDTSVGFLRSGSRLMGYAPTVLLISLVLATPIGLLKRLFLVIAGLMLLHAFIAFRLWVFVLQGGFADPTKDYRLYSPSPFWAKTLWRADKVLVENPDFHYVVPVIIWIALLVALSIFTTWRRRRAERAAFR
jgi:hypothetical protein